MNIIGQAQALKRLILKFIGLRRRDNLNYVKCLKGASPGVTATLNKDNGKKYSPQALSVEAQSSQSLLKQSKKLVFAPETKRQQGVFRLIFLGRNSPKTTSIFR